MTKILIEILGFFKMYIMTSIHQMLLYCSEISSCVYLLCTFFLLVAPVVQKVDNFIHWIFYYRADEMCAKCSR